ncbi:RecE family exodeoxyribonuclease [Serratia sp. T13T92]|uniref:RecE family exodeoxyribonuclease n=1 Tax=Serratia sp. T13T92 TaxID=3397496 RepID=UPI0039DFC705
MQNMYAYYLKAKQKSGKPSLFIYFEAKNDARALRDLENKIEDAELDPKEYFKPVRTNFPVVDDLPIEGVFSEPWCDRYCLGDDGLTWELIATEPAQQLPQVTAKPPAKDETTYSAIDLDKHTVIAAAWLFGRDCMKMTGEQLKAATRLMMDDSQRYPQNVIMALSNLKGFDYVYPDMPIVAIAAMKAIWPPFDKAPELGKISQFATEYLNAKVDDRQSVISKWQTTPNATHAPDPELPRTTSGAQSKPMQEDNFSSAEMISAIGDEALKKHTALSIMGINPSQAKARDVTNAKAMEDARDPAWRAWYTTYRVIPGIQTVDTDTRHAIISDGLKNLKLLADSDARLHFVKSRLVGHPGCPELANYTQALPAGDTVEDAPSTQDELATVAANEEMLTTETGRGAWLLGEVLAVLGGETTVMSVDEANALISAINGASRVYLARLIFKEIDVCDPFCQLSADDVHHITCDVMHQWIEDRSQRIDFINERVAFNLKEGRSVQPQENSEAARPDTLNNGETIEAAQQHQPGELRSMGGGKFDVSALFEASPLKDASAEPAPEITSNEGEKEEVDAAKDLDPTTRSAWLRREIMFALDGKTSVMSKDDVEELLTKAGDFNHVYLARLLAKEIEPCDPFKQLVEDDIYHLTCDVLEGWLDDKSQRIDLINERIESYLREGSAEPQSVTLENKEAVEVSTPVSETAPEVIASETAEPAVTYPAYFEPGRYHDIPNDVYHAANGISSTQVKDARISLMYFHGRHVIKSIARERSDALTFGSLVHTMALEPEKLTNDFNIEPIIPEGAFTGVASMRAFIEKHNATLPKMTDSDTLRSILDEHNAKLPTPYALGGNADEIVRIYTLLPQEFQSIAEGQKFTATAMKACIKEYNATLPEMLKTSGGRDALLEQLATIDLEFATREKAIPAPLPVSGTKEDMAARIKTILPEAIFADEILDAWTSSDDGRQLVTQQQMQAAKAIQRALFTHPSAGPLLQHQNRAVEVSYFGIDEDTGLEVRVRPDLEIDLDGVRLGVDLKSTSMGRVKQDFLRAKLHREIIDRDYHLSAAMYCDVAAFDQFFWIFVNKDEGYHWVAIVEASPDLLELGRLEYKKAMRDIKQAFDTETWPAPITEEVIDDLNDFDQRRLEALRIA